MGRREDICAAILRYLHNHPGRPIGIRLPFDASSESWGELDGSSITPTEYRYACQLLLRNRKVIPYTPEALEEDASTSKNSVKRVDRIRQALQRFNQLQAIVLNPTDPGPSVTSAQPQPGKYLPKVEPGAQRPQPPSKPAATIKPAAQPKSSQPEPQPQPEPLPKIDIDQDLLAYARQSLLILRDHAGTEHPWQTLGKQDCARLIRDGIPGVSKSSSQRLLQLLQVCGFVQLGTVDYVLAEGELAARQLRRAGFKPKETAGKLRTELQESYVQYDQLQGELQESRTQNDQLTKKLDELQRSKNELSQELTDTRTLLTNLQATASEQQQELSAYAELIEQAAEAQPTLGKPLLEKALVIIRRWQ